MQTLNELIEQLPPEFKQEVKNFVESLLKKQSVRHKKMRFTWAGALKEYRDQFTSLELQKKALQWWGD